MKTLQKLHGKEVSTVKINNSLKKYKTIPIFQDKTDKANEVLRTVGLPKRTSK